MVKIVGHRGARDLWPENSLLGFRETARLPIEAIEFDIHMTTDGGIVVIHDPSLDRTAEASGAVGDLTLAQATSTPLRGAGGECIPTLEQVLDIYQDSTVELHIEIKTDIRGNAYAGLERKAIDIVQRRGLDRRAVLTGFAPEVIDRFHALAPSIARLAALDRRSSEMLGGMEAALRRLGAAASTMIAVEKSLLQHTQDLCLARIGQERLAAWVANTREDLTYWLSQPVRSVTTDRPDLVLEVRNALAGGGHRA